MTTATSIRSDNARLGGSATRFLEDLLDELQVTDREYHHLNLSIPLTAELIAAVRHTARSGERVLLVGGTMLLAEALVRLDVNVEIWRLPQQLLSPDCESRVAREVTPDCLSAAEIPPDKYGAIVLPYVIESLPANTGEFLRRARMALVAGGRIVLATRNQGRLGTRLAAIAGKPFAVRRPAGSLSLSWPSLPVYTEYHNDELRRLSIDAGLSVERTRFIDGSRLFLELEPMPIEAYLLKKIGQGARRIAPAMRDTILLELTSRPGDEGPLPAMPDVCVAVSAITGGNHLRGVLSALQNQTYPRDRYEIVVLHDGRNKEVRSIVAAAQASGRASIREIVDDLVEGPAIRNQALREIRAPIFAHTDDSCIIPGDWIEGAVVRFDDDTAAVTGPVFAGPESHPKYFDVPGTRPDPAERERWRTDLFPISNVFYRSSAMRAL
ncbi:MAG TPA: glycosyltransferase family A protein, partial [Dehalococcoidia bacterium]